jgi:hypothetical protein
MQIMHEIGDRFDPAPHAKVRNASPEACAGFDLELASRRFPLGRPSPHCRLAGFGDALGRTVERAA